MMKLLLIVCMCGFTSGYPDGAPDRACKGMVPHHPPTTTSGVNPFKLRISTSSYNPGDVITGDLYSVDNITFRGFLVEVGTAQEVRDEEKAVGEFIKLDSSIQKHICGKAAITHINKHHKYRVSFVWQAPSSSVGDISIRATVVQKYSPSKYWLGTFSQRITAE